MKRIYWLIGMIIFCLMSCTSEGETYYMDSITGDDSNGGTSPRRAWKTLARLNEQQFNPGDRILFKAGTEYIGSFHPKGSGTEELPIVVDKYGKGDKPILNGDGQELYTILLADNDHWNIKNLEIMNKGKEAVPGRKGIWIQVNGRSDSKHILLKRLIVHDVMGDKEANVPGGGIHLSSGRDSLERGFLDVTVDSCCVYFCRPWGVYMDAPKNTVKMSNNFIR